jgi:hypothetical protein
MIFNVRTIRRHDVSMYELSAAMMFQPPNQVAQRTVTDHLTFNVCIYVSSLNITSDEHRATDVCVNSLHCVSTVRTLKVAGPCRNMQHNNTM